MALNILGNNLFWQSRIDNTRLQVDAVKTQSIFKGLGKSIGKAAIFAGVGIAAGLAIKEIIKVNTKFEKSISLLSSLTGAVGEDLDFYRKKAIQFGESTTQSATQIADAFKLIGSKKPELLGTKEALAEVTKDTITLAEAANIDVTSAASALTTSLNLMSEGAEKSAEYINILAAASQKGAGDIPYLDRALEKSAKVAHDSNMTFAETAAMVEMLAPAFKEPSTAGLHFKAVLLRLQKQGFGFSSGMFDLQEALQEVRSELDNIEDPAERAGREIDIMGTRSITAGKVMLETRNKFKDFAATISGTNTAYEQAQTNTDNVAGSIVKLKSALEGAILKNSDFNDSLKNIIDSLTDTVRWLGENWVWIEKLLKTYLVYIAAVKGTALATSLYIKICKIALLLEKQKVIQTGTLTAAQLGYTGVVKSSTIAQSKFNKVMKANAIALVIAGLFAVVKLIKKYNATMTSSERIAKNVIDLKIKVIEQTEKEKRELDRLVKTAQNVNEEEKNRLKAIKKINEISPEFLGNITLETINTTAATDAINTYIEALQKKVRAQVADEYLTDIRVKMAKEEIRQEEILEKARKKGFKTREDLLRAKLGFLNVGGKEQVQLIKSIQRHSELNKEFQEMEAVVRRLEINFSDLLETAERYKPPGDGDGDGEKLEKGLHDELLMRQANELAKFKLTTDSEKQLALFRKYQEIEYLNAEISKNEALEPIQKETLEKQVEFLEKEAYEIYKSSSKKEKAAKNIFKIKQELALAEFLLITDNEQAITDFKRDQEIERLNNQIKNNKDLLEDERKTLLARIALLEKQRDATDDAAESNEFLLDIAKKTGDMFASTLKRSEDSAESFGDTMKKVTREVILMLVAESVAHVMKDVFKEAGWLGLVLAPVAGAAAAGILNTVIPGFTEGGVYEGPGVVPGQGNKDNVNARLTPNEVVSNGRQQANLLFNMSNQRFSSNKMEILLKENNDLLRNAKSAVMKDNIMYIVKAGKITGEKIYLT